MPSLFDFLVNVWSYLSSQICFCTHSPLENIKGFHFCICKCWLLVLVGFWGRFTFRDPPDSQFIVLLLDRETCCIVMVQFLFFPRNALTSNSQSSVATVEPSGENQCHFAWFWMGNVDIWIFKEVGRRLNQSVSRGLLRICRMSLNSSWVG